VTQRSVITDLLHVWSYYIVDFWQRSLYRVRIAFLWGGAMAISKNDLLHVHSDEAAALLSLLLLSNQPSTTGVPVSWRFIAQVSKGLAVRFI